MDRTADRCYTSQQFPGVLAAQWIEQPIGVTEVVDSIPAEESDSSVVSAISISQLAFHPSHGRITPLIITITIFSNLIGAITALFFTNYCVGLKSDSYIRQSY